MGKNRRDKTTGLPLPSPVVPVSTLCVQITIPNAPEYRQALRGVLSDLGKPWQWAQTVGEDNQDAYTAAELWRSALQTLVYVDDCDGSMSCLDVANCIDTNENVQSAIDERISSSPSIQQDTYNYSTVGVPMLPSQRDTVVTGSVGCDLNSVFGSVTAIIDQLNRNNEDFLEIIQLTDNAQQRVSKVLKAIPLVNELPIDEGLDFISELTGELKENYEAEYTSSYRDTLRCALFCAAQAAAGCELSFQDIITIFNNRVGTSLEPINFFEELVAFVLAGSWPGTVAVDVLTLIQLAVWQQASNWTGVSLRTLQTVGLLGANDDDPDWEILCTDCPEVFYHTFDLTLNDGGFSQYGTPSSGTFGYYVLGQGWHSDFAVAGGNSYQMVQIGRVMTTRTVTRMRLTYNMTNGANAGLTRLLTTDTVQLGASTDIPADGIDQTYDASANAPDSTFIGLRVQAGNQGGSADPGGVALLTKVEVWGLGTDPF